MTEQHDLENKDSPREAIELGARLRAAREAGKLTTVDAANRLNLETSVIEALESDNYEGLPERTFIRGYLVAYLKLLELPESLLKEFDSNERVKAYVPLSSTRDSTFKSSCSRDGWVKCINVGLVVLLLAALVIWLLEQQFHLIGLNDYVQTPKVTKSEPVKADEQKPAMPEVAEEASPMADFTPDYLSETDNAGTTQEEVQSADASVTSQVEDNPATAVTDETPQSESLDEQKPVEHTLLLKFSDASWMQVKDADDTLLVNSTFHAGDEKLLLGKPPFRLVVGRIRNVAIEYDGKPFDVAQYYDKKVARFSIGSTTENNGG